MPTRNEITAALAAQRERLGAWYRALPDEELARPLTASEAPGGAMWSPKDHLAHVLGVERFFQGAIRRAVGGAEDALGFFTQTGTDDHAGHMNLINQANQRSVEKYYDLALGDIFTRLDETRQATLAQLGDLSDAQLAQPVAHSPFGDGTLGALFLTIAEHAGQHLGWLDRARAARTD